MIGISGNQSSPLGLKQNHFLAFGLFLDFFLRGDGERDEPEPEVEDDVLGERRRLELLDLPLDDFFFVVSREDERDLDRDLLLDFPLDDFFFVSREEERDLDRDLLLDFPLVDLFFVSREDERDLDLERDLLDLVPASMERERDLDLDR